MSRGSARATFVIGLLLSFPGASYLASLTEIERQNLSDVEIVLTVLAVNLIMLMLLELPLISYTVAPQWTPLAIEAPEGLAGPKRRARDRGRLHRDRRCADRARRPRRLGLNGAASARDARPRAVALADE